MDIYKKPFCGDVESKRRRDRLDAEVKRVVQAAVLHRSCLSCEHFIERDINGNDVELCLFGGCNMRPPARVLVLGCENYSEEIPF